MQKIIFRCRLLDEVKKFQTWKEKKFLKYFVENICCYFIIIGKKKKTFVHITNSIDELTKSNSGALHNSQLKWEIVNIHLKCHSKLP